MEVKKIGRTTVIIDLSYVESVTPEQAEIDRTRADFAVADMCDEMDEAV